VGRHVRGRSCDSRLRPGRRNCIGTAHLEALGRVRGTWETCPRPRNYRLRRSFGWTAVASLGLFRKMLRSFGASGVGFEGSRGKEGGGGGGEKAQLRKKATTSPPPVFTGERSREMA